MTNAAPIIVAGENYGQGSSREHAALCPLYLGVRAVIAKSFARIHKANLINNGILPLTFVNPDDYDQLVETEELIFTNLPAQIKAGQVDVFVKRLNKTIRLAIDLGARQEKLLLAGGLLATVKDEQARK